MSLSVKNGDFSRLSEESPSPVDKTRTHTDDASVCTCTSCECLHKWNVPTDGVSVRLDGGGEFETAGACDVRGRRPLLREVRVHSLVRRKLTVLQNHARIRTAIRPCSSTFTSPKAEHTDTDANLSN